MILFGIGSLLRKVGFLDRNAKQAGRFYARLIAYKRVKAQSNCH